MTADRITDLQQAIAADPGAGVAVRTGKTDAPVFHELQREVRALPSPPQAAAWAVTGRP
jgi:hypothetical protein